VADVEVREAGRFGLADRVARARDRVVEPQHIPERSAACCVARSDPLDHIRELLWDGRGRQVLDLTPQHADQHGIEAGTAAEPLDQGVGWGVGCRTRDRNAQLPCPGAEGGVL